jgi:hypothetical protein
MSPPAQAWRRRRERQDENITGQSLVVRRAADRQPPVDHPHEHMDEADGHDLEPENRPHGRPDATSRKNPDEHPHAAPAPARRPPCSRARRSMSASATEAPAAAKPRALAQPMPEAAPVISAARPDISAAMSPSTTPVHPLVYALVSGTGPPRRTAQGRRAARHGRGAKAPSGSPGKCQEQRILPPLPSRKHPAW